MYTRTNVYSSYTFTPSTPHRTPSRPHTTAPPPPHVFLPYITLPPRISKSTNAAAASSPIYAYIYIYGAVVKFVHQYLHLQTS